MHRKTLLCYSAGHLIAAVYSCIDFYLLKFYTDVVGLAPVLVGLAMGIRFVIDALNDPFVGYLSDHTNSARGRRRPFFLIGATVSAFLLWVVFTPPSFESQFATFAFLMCFLTLLFDFTSVFQIPHEALAAELTYDYAERIRLSAYRKYFDSTGDMLGLFVVAVISQITFQENGHALATERWVYSLSAAILGGVVILAGLITFLGTDEEGHQSMRCHYSVIDGMINTWRNEACRTLLISTILGMLGVQVAVAQLLYILTYFLQIAEASLPTILVCFFAGSVCLIPIWAWLARKIGKKYCLIVAMLSTTLAFILVVAYRWPALAIHPIAFVVGGAITGIQGTGMALWPDIVEWDELVTGERREGSYAAVRAFATKLSLGFGILAVGCILSWIGYDGKSKPAPSVITGLRLSFCLLPAICLLSGALTMRRFPISLTSHTQALITLGRTNPATAKHVG
jgi:GPH family glycoside/pentoside/hexuronide:cation symporter